MSKFSREELDEMWRRWIEANTRAEETNDWKTHLGPFYTEDAVYTWKVGHDSEFAANNRQEIIDNVMGFEMLGLEGWTYPYEKVVIDHVIGEVVGYWGQVTPFKREDGTPYQTIGLGASWFKYAGNYQWSEQLDIFDSGDIMGVIAELANAGLMTDKLKKRIEAYGTGEAPGTTKVGS